MENAKAEEQEGTGRKRQGRGNLWSIEMPPRKANCMIGAAMAPGTLG